MKEKTSKRSATKTEKAKSIKHPKLKAVNLDEKGNMSPIYEKPKKPRPTVYGHTITILDKVREKPEQTEGYGSTPKSHKAQSKLGETAPKRRDYRNIKIEKLKFDNESLIISNNMFYKEVQELRKENADLKAGLPLPKPDIIIETKVRHIKYQAQAEKLKSTLALCIVALVIAGLYILFR